MTHLDKINKAITDQFDLFICAHRHNTLIDICWEQARALCTNDIGTTEMVDEVYNTLCSYYTNIMKNLSDVNSNLYDLSLRDPKYLDPDPQLRRYIKEEQLLNDKCMYESFLRDLEPAVSKAFNDEEVVYYTLSYME